MRKDTWESDFGNWLESVRRRPFEWGKFDCALMAAECAEVITGTHPEPDLVGAYYTPWGAFKILHGEDGLSAMCDKHYKRVPVPLAWRGDIVLGQFNRKETLMINTGADYLVMTTEGPRLAERYSIQATTAWRVE